MGVFPVRIMTACFFIALFFMCGCAAKLPRLEAPSVQQQEAAEIMLQRYLERPRIAALDADIRIHWDMPASSGGVDGLLQVQKEGLLRLTIVDPLGRSLYILVSNGRTFTLVDNQEGKGYQGAVEAEFLESYIPAHIISGDLFSLLGGLMPGEREQVDEVGIDGKNIIWYAFRAGRNEHRILLEGAAPVMRRHVIEDNRQGENTSIAYSDYFPVDPAGSLWPRLITLTGNSIYGTLQLEIKDVVSVLPGDAANFQIAIPPHFSRERVQ